MCYYAPFGSKEMWNWHTTVTIKKQQTLEQVLYRVPNHCIRAVKTATSYTDRTKLLPTFAARITNPLAHSRNRRSQILARRRLVKISCSQVLRCDETRAAPTGRDPPRSNKAGPCNVNKGVTNGTSRILDTSTTWHKIL